MAVRQEDLLVREAVVYTFPAERSLARNARQAMLARRRRTLGAVSLITAIAALASLPPL